MKEENIITLTDMFYKSTSMFSNREAIVFGAKRISYKEVKEISGKFASALYREGIRKGDRVCLWLHNCPEFIYSYFAIISLGAIVVPINNLFKREEAKFIAENSQASIIIVSIDKVEDSKIILSRVSSLKHIICVSYCNDASVEIFYKLIEEETPLFRGGITADCIAEIIYTSGTTGIPKGASLTHRNLLSNVKDCVDAIKVKPKDSFLCILPLFHSFASTVCMLLPFYRGARIVLMRTVKPFARVLRVVYRNRVTVFVGVPSIYNILAQMRMPWYKRFLAIVINPVRIFISGAAPLSAEVLKKFEKKFKRPLLEGYGLTEASPVVSLNLPRRRKLSSVGLPLPSLKVRVVDDKGASLSTGKTGELLVKGPNVMKGYYGLQEETDKVIKEGWLYTGDLAFLDEEGYIYIRGRKKDMINVRGFNVYPREIEELLYKQPEVKEAACVGVRHPHRGEVPVAFVAGDGINERSLLRYLRANLASYKVPVKIIKKDKLPKNTTGKILKRELKKEVENIFFKTFSSSDAKLL